MIMLTLIGLVAVLFCAIGYFWGYTDCKNEAIEADVAEYVLMNEYGLTEFKWKTPFNEAKNT